jgi:hypothetical protein
MDNYQDPIENTDGNYISMTIEELPYERKDEGAYLKFPGDDDNLENLPVFITASKSLTKKRRMKSRRMKSRRMKSRRTKSQRMKRKNN